MTCTAIVEVVFLARTDCFLRTLVFFLPPPLLLLGLRIRPRTITGLSVRGDPAKSAHSSPPGVQQSGWTESAEFFEKDDIAPHDVGQCPPH